MKVRGELPRFARARLAVRRDDEKEPGEWRFVSTYRPTEVLHLRLGARYEVTVTVDGEVRYRGTHEAGTGEGEPIAVENDGNGR